MKGAAMSGYDEDLKKACEILNNIAEKVAKQPQLTIPKSIADELDNIFNEFVSIKNSRSIWHLLWRAEEIDEDLRMQLVKILPDENQVNIAVAYLAGKALGVDLVKVVEG